MTQRDVQIDHVADDAPWYAGPHAQALARAVGQLSRLDLRRLRSVRADPGAPARAAIRCCTPEQVASSGAIYAGLAIGITLLGWGIGGLAGGVIADYVGRKRTMVLAVFFYALLTGITAFSTSLTMLIAMRFLTGLAIGAEWSTGIALVAESWPDKARPEGARPAAIRVRRGRGDGGA